MMGLAMCAGFSSCDDDDDEKLPGKDTSSLVPGVFTTPEGNKLEKPLTALLDGSYYGWKYQYDANGALTSFSSIDNYDGEYNFDVKVSAKPFSIQQEDSKLDLRCNNEGYIVYIQYVTQESMFEGDEEESDILNVNDATIDISTKFNFKYNAKGQVTESASTATGKGNVLGINYKITITYKTAFTYDESGVISKIVKTQVWDYGVGEKESAERTITFSAKDAFNNKFCQMDPTIAKFASQDEESPFFALAMLGYMGRGSAMIPTSCEVLSVFSGEDDDNYDDTFKVVLNDDGSINKYDYYDFVYGDGAVSANKSLKTRKLSDMQLAFKRVASKNK